MRLFVAIPLQGMHAQQVALLAGGIPHARWEPVDQLHLTLRFVGETDGGQRRALCEALGKLDMPSFDLSLAGTGHFPPRGEPRLLWVGVEPCPALIALQARIEQRVRALGFAPETRNFAPHVTIAHLQRSAPGRKVAAFLGYHAGFATPPFTVDHVTLMSSVLHPNGARHAVEAEFALTAP